MTKTIDNSWINTVKTYSKCPFCLKGILDTRIKRGFFAKHIFTGLGKKYRCNTCGKTKYIKE